MGPRQNFVGTLSYYFGIWFRFIIGYHLSRRESKCMRTYLLRCVGNNHESLLFYNSNHTIRNLIVRFYVLKRLVFYILSACVTVSKSKLNTRSWIVHTFACYIWLSLSMLLWKAKLITLSNSISYVYNLTIIRTGQFGCTYIFMKCLYAYLGYNVCPTIMHVPKKAALLFTRFREFN